MPGTEQIDGSPQGGKLWANTNNPGTANNSSTSENLSKSAGPVPLYLLPQTLSQEIHEFGDSIIEVNIRRTRGHNYLIRLTASAKEEEANES
ncbi:hypothetical protein [Methanolacinia paynteri]|uniref:hypothetical protein n=1 Tax=Methanolacinia paynteri TaxID=230356 RepID=UPI000A00F7FD|nr:hypothetical protein [Methanolacinia paynteri]